MSKNLVIEQVPQSTLCRIRWEGGGEVPAKLSGEFTNPVVAKQFIDAWLAENPDRDVEVKNAPSAERLVPKPKGRVPMSSL